VNEILLLLSEVKERNLFNVLSSKESIRVGKRIERTYKNVEERNEERKRKKN
jgi:hypothetical protein